MGAQEREAEETDRIYAALAAEGGGSQAWATPDSGLAKACQCLDSAYRYATYIYPNSLLLLLLLRIIIIIVTIILQVVIMPIIYPSPTLSFLIASQGREAFPRGLCVSGRVLRQHRQRRHGGECVGRDL